MSNDKITEKVLAKAAEEGLDSFIAGENLVNNPYDKEKNYVLWEAFINGYLDAKSEYDKL